MPDFNWVANPRTNGCLGCLAVVNDKGFIDTWAEAMGEKGVLDVVFCADCVQQMARQVGCASPDEVERFAVTEFDLMTENEKLKDEIDAWRQRMERALDLKIEDLNLDMPADEVLNEQEA